MPFHTHHRATAKNDYNPICTPRDESYVMNDYNPICTPITAAREHATRRWRIIDHIESEA